jgi:outer membrane lipoprotein carrier protein
MRPFLVTALVLTAAGLGSARQQPAAGDLAGRIQARYERVRDFTADFTQTTKSALLPQTTTERGRVKILKPSRMRWDYLEPERKIVGADGDESYFYVVADRVVTFSPLPPPGTEDTALMFLAGRGDLTRDYLTHMPAAQPPGEWHLALTPHASQEYSYLVLIVDRKTLQIRGIDVYDEQGGLSSIRLTNYRENQGLKPAEFELTPPPGVEVIGR